VRLLPLSVTTLLTRLQRRTEPEATIETSKEEMLNFVGEEGKRGANLEFSWLME
jgi:hypothetical protein